jgi:hypothetical protein
MEFLTDDLGSYVVWLDIEQGDAASAAPSERGASAVPEAFGILGPIPTIPSGCSGSLAAGADVLSRPSPRAALSPREAPVPSACPCQRIRAVTSGQPRLMEIGSDLAVRRRSWTGALPGKCLPSS